MTTETDMQMVEAGSTSLASAHGNLSPNQRRFLSSRLGFATDAECAEVVGVSYSAVMLWKREIPAFRAAYDDLMTNGIEEWASQERRRLLGKALLTAESLMEATDTVYTKNGDAIGTQANHRARRDGAEIVMRANGLWNPQERGSSQNDALAGFMSRMADIIEGKANRTEPPIIEGESRPIDG